jgi:hypothetical protein
MVKKPPEKAKEQQEENSCRMVEEEEITYVATPYGAAIPMRHPRKPINEQ